MVRAVLSDEETEKEEQRLAEWRKSGRQGFRGAGSLSQCLPKTGIEMYGEGRRPSLWLELTAHCNLNCAFCYNEWRPRVRGEYPVALSFDYQCVNIAH